jgi:hypothetical protein
MFATSQHAVSAIFFQFDKKKLKNVLLPVDAFSFSKLIQRLSWALMEGGAEKTSWDLASI